jgi:hypothetical protein
MIEPPPVDPSEPENLDKEALEPPLVGSHRRIPVGLFVIAGVFGDTYPEPAAYDDRGRQR